jgi:hypothetical protein
VNQLEIIAPNDIALAEHAAVIRALGKRVVGDVIEIGRRLTDCKRIAGHGGWYPWLDREFGWSEDTAENYMNVFRAFGPNPESVRDLSLPMNSLRLLASPSTPEEARTEVIERAENGEKLTHAKVKQMIADAKETTASDYELRISKLTKRYEEQAERLRCDLAALSTDALEAAINEALGPLQAKIKRMEDERDKRHEDAPKRKDEFGTRTAAIANALRGFSSTLTIGAPQVIEHNKIVAEATNRSLDETMAEMIANARTAEAWLRQLLSEEKIS